MMRGKHSQLHDFEQRDDKGKRRCIDCGSDKTRIRVRKNRPSSTEDWQVVDKEKKLYRCRKCYKAERRRERVARGLPRD